MTKKLFSKDEEEELARSTQQLAKEPEFADVEYIVIDGIGYSRRQMLEAMRQKTPLGQELLRNGVELMKAIEAADNASAEK